MVPQSLILSHYCRQLAGDLLPPVRSLFMLFGMGGTIWIEIGSRKP